MPYIHLSCADSDPFSVKSRGSWTLPTPAAPEIEESACIHMWVIKEYGLVQSRFTQDGCYLADTRIFAFRRRQGSCGSAGGILEYR